MKKLLALYLQRNRGTMLLLMLMVMPLLWLLWSLTLDGTEARHTAFKTKTALNRAVKAAALALDKELLAAGEVGFEETQARNNFNRVFQLNLNLNPDFSPRIDSPLSEPPELLDYYVCKGSEFPFAYESVRGIVHIFKEPGILAVVRVKHKNTFAGQEQEIFVYAAAETER